MKKILLVLLFLGLCLIAKSQSIPQDGLVIVEFNAPFSGTKCEYLGKLSDCETAKIDINPNGELNGSIKLDVLSGKDRSEIYYFNGMLDDKIWGTSPDESFFKVYLQIKK